MLSAMACGEGGSESEGRAWRVVLEGRYPWGLRGLSPSEHPLGHCVEEASKEGSGGICPPPPVCALVDGSSQRHRGSKRGVPGIYQWYQGNTGRRQCQ